MAVHDIVFGDPCSDLGVGSCDRVDPTLKVGLLGTRGVPARYGGFETAAEEIGSRLATYGHRVVVYCRNPGQQLRAYRGMELVNLPAIRFKVA